MNRLRRRSVAQYSTALVCGLAALVLVACDPGPGSQPPGATASAPLPPESAANAPSIPTGELERIGSLSILRAAHTATLLPDGRVFVAGGCFEHSCDGITATTELVDPETGTTEPGPDMRQGRVGHAAVVLLDGRILLIGGFVPGDVTETTDVYDPATGEMTPGPDLLEARADPVAIRLADGSVLIAGGRGTGGSLSVATAELLAPDSSAFRTTSSMAVSRSAHAGTVLADGRVFVVGGSTGGNTGELHATAEIYDPASGTWSVTNEMSVPRHKHAAVPLADGRVLVVGGSDERDGGGRYRSAELFDPESGTFTLTGEMALPRYKINGGVVRLADGRVLVAAGARLVEVFDPATGTFAPVGGTTDAAYSFSTAVLLDDGSVLVMGGYDDQIRLTDQVLRFVP